MQGSERAGSAGEPADLPACTECGYCCFFDDPRYVMVFEHDSERLGELAAVLTVSIRGRSFMRQKDGHCIALVPHGEYFHCSIYERRPSLCREFERGCATCHAVVARGNPTARGDRRHLPVAR